MSVALHHDVHGPGGAPVLVLAGSLGTTLEMWDGQLPLAARLRLVRVDHRGHGGSPAPPGPYEIADLGRDVVTLLDRLAIERASYCGLSIGGMVGIWLAAHVPERIERLVLICTSARMAPATAWADRAAAVRAAGSTEVIADAVVERWLTPDFAAAHPDLRARLRAMLAATPAAGYAACCGAIERMDLRGDLTRITAPTLVVSGADDPAASLEHQHLISQRIPGARHEVVGPAAHLASVEQAAAVNDLILEHLEPVSHDTYEAGMRVRREVLGNAHVDSAVVDATEFTAPFQEFITRYAWGDVWAREGLDRRTRSAITLALLTALGRENEIAMHVRAARTTGLTPVEIAEVLLHTAVYAGVPAANAAFRWVKEVLGEELG